MLLVGPGSFPQWQSWFHLYTPPQSIWKNTTQSAIKEFNFSFNLRGFAKDGIYHLGITAVKLNASVFRGLNIFRHVITENVTIILKIWTTVWSQETLDLWVFYLGRLRQTFTAASDAARFFFSLLYLDSDLLGLYIGNSGWTPAKYQNQYPISTSDLYLLHYYFTRK